MTTIEKLDMNVKQANSDFVAIKNKIVENGVEIADGTRTAEYAEKIDEVYEAGKQAEYDAFWDAYQDNGNRVDYQNCFSGKGWTDVTFKPKYDIITQVAYMLFRNCAIHDLGAILRENDKKVIINHKTLQYTFNSTLITVIDEVEFQQIITTLENTFASSAYFREIRTPIPISEATTFNRTFYSCSALEEVRFDGIIGQNGLDLQWSPNLSWDSIVSIINALSTTTSGLTVTLSKAAVDKAFETSEGANDGSTNSIDWSILADTKTNWTIALA